MIFVNILFFFVAIVSIYSGIIVFKKYKDISSFFYLIFSLLLPIWLLFNQLILLGKIENILYYYRLLYCISLIGFYSVLFFLVYYKEKSIKKRGLLSISLFYVFLYITIVHTPFFIQSVHRFDYSHIIYEEYGKYYIFLVLLYIILFPLFLFFIVLKFRKLSYLDTQRLSYIVGGFILSIGLPIILQVIIPYFSSHNTTIGDAYIVISLLPLMFSIIYSSSRYNFSSIKIRLKEILLWGSSLLYTIVSVLFIHKIINILNDKNTGFSFFYILVGIGLFFLFQTFVFKKSDVEIYNGTFGDIYKALPNLLYVGELEIYIKNILQKNHSISNFQILGENNIPQGNIFEHMINEDVIIHDPVFFEKYPAEYYEQYRENYDEYFQYLFFPIYNFSQKIKAYVVIGKKKYLTGYTQEEIQEFKKFIIVLQHHFEYIDTYRKLQDMTISLDKKVDEKTIQYNTLIGKQREFIRYLGHEIKNPLTNIIFLSDEIKSQIQEKSQDAQIQEDIHLLYEELIRISNLVKQVFSAEQFDLEKIKFYKTRIPFSKFLLEITRGFVLAHPDIECIVQIDSSLGEHEIDEIQFTQMIQNLFHNAIKFSNKIHPKVRIIARKNEKGRVEILISDNGKGFTVSSKFDIFEKYSTGIGNDIGLGLGLYLCKRIAEMHGGKIKARNSQDLGGAEFVITLF